MSRGRRRAGRTSRRREKVTREPNRARNLRLVIIGAVAMVLAAAIVAIGRHPDSGGPPKVAAYPVLPSKPGSYLGVYQADSPDSYAGLAAFTKNTGVRPNLVSYYSGWQEPFRTDFASAAARHGAVPLVQIEPDGVRLSAITAGHYDAYLRGYAAAVRAYGHPVILSFCHEMNGWWYSWGYRHATPAAFVAAWRHVVTLFRTAGAGNVSWLWTVNVINAPGGVRAPAPWWPGGSYVDWIGIDGYYKQSWTFAPLFGPTIKAVRALAHDPVLIAETGVAPVADKPAKITDLFTGVHAYGLLGFVWFNAVGIRDWRLDSPADTLAFRRGAEAYKWRP